MMTNDLLGALDRTLLLMRDDVLAEAGDQALLDALTGSEIALVADLSNIKCHSAQTSYITSALLMAHSGHRIYLVAPDAPLVGTQAPLKPAGLVSSLLEIGADLLPGIEFVHRRPNHEIDLAVCFGSSPANFSARRTLSLFAGPWSARLARSPTITWSDEDWPFGGMGVAALAAGEAFKIAMQKLRCFARNPQLFASQFAPNDEVSFELAPVSTCKTSVAGQFDFISAGAIANAALYAISRIPGVVGAARVIDDDSGAHSNLNRNMLVRRSSNQGPKVSMLASADLGGLGIKPMPYRFDSNNRARFGSLAPRVLLGVDDIPTRWDIQRENPEWLGIGATTHWSAMASFHSSGVGCAGCLHPRDDPTEGPIPTVAFVSFWAGLLLAAYFVRAVSGEKLPLDAQQTYLTAIRPESPWHSTVAMSQNCPVRRH